MCPGARDNTFLTTCSSPCVPAAAIHLDVYLSRGTAAAATAVIARLCEARPHRPGGARRREARNRPPNIASAPSQHHARTATRSRWPERPAYSMSGDGRRPTASAADAAIPEATAGNRFRATWLVESTPTGALMHTGHRHPFRPATSAPSWPLKAKAENRNDPVTEADDGHRGLGRSLRSSTATSPTASRRRG